MVQRTVRPGPDPRHSLQGLYWLTRSTGLQALARPTGDLGQASCPSKPRSVLQREGFDLGQKVPVQLPAGALGRVSAGKHSGGVSASRAGTSPGEGAQPTANAENRSQPGHHQPYRRQTSSCYSRQILSHGSKWQGRLGNQAEKSRCPQTGVSFTRGYWAISGDMCHCHNRGFS